MSPILVTLTSRSDSNFDPSNITLKENKWDGVDQNSNGLDYYVQKNGFRQTVQSECTAVFIKVATSTLHLDHVTRSKIAFRSCGTVFGICN